MKGGSGECDRGIEGLGVGEGRGWRGEGRVGMRAYRAGVVTYGTCVIMKKVSSARSASSTAMAMIACTLCRTFWQTVWRQADKYGVPRICFVNKMDRLGANFYRTIDMIVSNLGANPLVLQLPIGAEETFSGVVDLVKMQSITWDGEELGATFQFGEIPEDLKEKAAEYRAKLVEQVVEQVGS